MRKDFQTVSLATSSELDADSPFCERPEGQPAPLRRKSCVGIDRVVCTALHRTKLAFRVLPLSAARRIEATCP